MSTDELKLQLFREIDALDASNVKEVYGLILNYIKSKQDADNRNPSCFR